MRKNLLIAACLAVFASCGPRVKPISLHDQTVPVDSRRFVADTEDALSIARASRDEAERRLEEVREWRREVVRGVDWPRAADGAIEKLRVLADERVELAELELEEADLAVDLAEAKWELTTAETAVRHDIARYDLEKFRARTEEARARKAAMTDEILAKRDAIDERTSEWWAAYSSWAKKGDTRLYYVPFLDVEASKAPAKTPKKKADEVEKEQQEEGAPSEEAEPKEKESEELRIW